MLPGTRNETSFLGLFSDLAHGLQETSDIGPGAASSGEEKRRSIEIMMMRMRHDAMSGCAG